MLRSVEFREAPVAWLARELSNLSVGLYSC
jgi:hypothetical protein